MMLTQEYLRECFDDAVRARKNMEAALGFHPNHGNGLSVAASQ